MTDKERLEQAKEMVDDFKQEYETHHPMFGKEDIETMFWLIQQAERVQELEEIIEVDGLAFNSLENMYINLEQQNKRYREVIENAQEHLIHAESYKAFQILRKALEELS